MAARPRTVALLLLAGAAISAVTMLRGIDPFDEGFMLSTVDRLGRGQTLYADFTWPYGPGHPYLLEWLADAFGRSLIWWRVVRVACDAGVAALVYVIVRRRVGPGWSLTAWLCAACAMAQPVSANPFPPALLAGLAALALVTAPVPNRRAWLWAGLLTGVAALWRLDFGLYAAGAVGLTLLLRGQGTRAKLTDAARFSGVAFAVGLLGYAPFIATVGPADLYAALVGDSARERDYWTLPFPLSYDGSLRLWPPTALASDAKDVLEFYVPLLVLAGIGITAAGWVVWLRDSAHRAQAWVWAGGLLFALGGALYLTSRADEFHANPGIVALAIALPVAAGLLLTDRAPAARAAGAMAATVLALLTLYGVANRLSATFQPLPADPLDLPVADGVRARPTDARALPPVVARVQALVPAGQPIYVTTRRSDIVRYSNPLMYVLTDRPNVLDRDVGLFGRARDQDRIVQRLRTRRPRAVVRWLDPISSRREPNLRGKTGGNRTVDRYLAREYRPVLRRGQYEVLAPR